MKKFIVLISALFALAFTSQVFAVGSGTGIAGSPHDFTDNLAADGTTANTETTWNTSGQICKVCHVPHDSPAAAGSGALWSRAESAVVTSYTMYDATWSSSIDGATTDPDGTAKLCLSCHDGTVALDSYDGKTPTGPTLTAYDSGMVAGTVTSGDLDMTSDHPISIVFDDAADTGLNDPAGTTFNGGPINDVLDFGKVQCSSCHDVHDQDSVAGTPLLRITTDGSALCLACHNK